VDNIKGHRSHPFILGLFNNAHQKLDCVLLSHLDDIDLGFLAHRAKRPQQKHSEKYCFRIFPLFFVQRNKLANNGNATFIDNVTGIVIVLIKESYKETNRSCGDGRVERIQLN